MSDQPSPAMVAVLEPTSGGRSVRRVPVDAPILTAFDLAATRGDGAFEAMLIRRGRPNKPDRHLARMARSTALLEIEGPTDAEWSELVEELVGDWPAEVEGVLKLVVSRGQEAVGASAPPTAYGTLVPIDADLLRQRAGGIHVVALSFGYPAAVRAEAPWLLGGVKYLSYAVNMAAKRHAAELGVDDVVFVSADGEVLEGPNSTVVWLDGRTLVTPPADTGILRGTTQELLFDTCSELGLGAQTRTTTVDDLRRADAVWLLSSTRGVAEVRSIDGQPLASSDLTPQIAALVGIPATDQAAAAVAAPAGGTEES